MGGIKVNGEEESPKKPKIEKMFEGFKKRDISPEIDRIRGGFIGPLIRIENTLDKFLRRYFCTHEKEDEFQEKILDKNCFNLSTKISIFQSVVKTLLGELKDKQDEYYDKMKENSDKKDDFRKKMEEIKEERDELKKKNQLMSLGDIKDYRNKFAHDEIVKKEDTDDFEIKSDNGTEIIDEEYITEFKEKVKKTRVGIDSFYDLMVEEEGRLNREVEEMLEPFFDIEENLFQNLIPNIDDLVIENNYGIETSGKSKEDSNDEMGEKE